MTTRKIFRIYGKEDITVCYLEISEIEDVYPTLWDLRLGYEEIELIKFKDHQVTKELFESLLERLQDR